ncbi:hypothetical protein OG298_04970 [Streptomyces sp. NBC_01005]|uniref:hypothetical protein n=1 Tax=unclassified Streptomyces TaxID=2593676 RepID=UPI003865396A|nr:hypothetical protein OG298_04970 [Streptomyces sp. NBC_01005]WTC93245.1 hypothetical protein OH736_04965 [Streptomyces sp. NBC_01650]
MSDLRDERRIRDEQVPDRTRRDDSRDRRDPDELQDDRRSGGRRRTDTGQRERLARSSRVSDRPLS